jgi:single-strand DNA-binding protein
MLNKYIAIGNLTNDAKIQEIKSNKLCTFSLAVNNPTNNKDVCFIDVETWGKVAENCSKFLSKGSKIFIEGRLKYSCWETKDGSKKCKVSCIADYVQFMSTKEFEEPMQTKEGESYEIDQENDDFDELADVPF